MAGGRTTRLLAVIAAPVCPRRVSVDSPDFEDGLGSPEHAVAAPAAERQPQRRVRGQLFVHFHGPSASPLSSPRWTTLPKVNDLLEISKTISTLPSMVEHHIQKGSVRQPGSHTWNLLRVKRGFDIVKVLFE